MRVRYLIGLGIAATVACYVLVERTQTNGIISFYRESLSGPMFVFWLAALVGTTIGPPTCAICFWLLSDRSQHGWLLHITLVPTMYIAFRLSAALMLFAAGEPDLDALSGYAVVPAIVLSAICLAAYFVALGFRHCSKAR